MQEFSELRINAYRESLDVLCSVEVTVLSKNVIEAIEERRSVRQFKQDPIPESVVNRIIDCGLKAPSAGNIQPWQFWVIWRPSLKAALAEAAFGQEFVGQAPIVMAVLAEPARSATRYGYRGSELYCIQDTAAAVQNMILAALAYGIGSCWVGAFDEKKVSKALNLSERFRPVALVPMGYPAELPARRPRSCRPLEETVITVQ
jgi:nitroreductase